MLLPVGDTRLCIRDLRYISIWQYIDKFFMYHDTILCCRDIDISYVMVILNHMCYKVNAYTARTMVQAKKWK